MATAGALLASHGIHGWSVEQVAAGAGCAKGLVHYHFGTRAALLTAVVDEMARGRMARRSAALAPGGTAALDALWAVMRDDASTGVSRAWLEAGLDGSAGIRHVMAPSDTELQQFAAASSAAMELPNLPPRRAATLLLLLDALEAALVRGAPGTEVREAYDRVWLGMM
ncbi:MAG TPA: helix-turn-helix domain-containing protein [Gemmatimonadales bacterium]|nr:helix-turn-helix domain-containing protein [Gemmatimonadales bacterium]